MDKRKLLTGKPRDAPTLRGAVSLTHFFFLATLEHARARVRTRVGSGAHCGSARLVTFFVQALASRAAKYHKECSGPM